MKNTSLTVILVLAFFTTIQAQPKKSPSFEEVISLTSVSNPQISPNGEHIAYTHNTVDWENNRYDTEIWLSKSGDKAFQLTNNLKSNSSNPKWSPDSKWIAFLSNRSGKTQVQAIRAAGGESFQVTNTKQNISAFEWSPDGKSIAFIQTEDKSKEEKKREDKYGGYAVEDQEYSKRQLWLIDFIPQKLYANPLPEQLEDSTYKAEQEAKQLMAEASFSISSFQWSPDGKKIAFNHQPDPLINSFFHSDISIYDLRDKSHNPLVSNPSADFMLAWSPDSKSILYQSSLDDSTSNYYKNNKIFRINLSGEKNQQLAQDFDENISQIRWIKAGIYGVAWQKTDRLFVRIDPESGATSIIKNPIGRFWGFSFSSDEKMMAYSASGDEDLTEIYRSDTQFASNLKVSRSTDQLDNWKTAKSEVISWKSKDGATIEGVLHKPQDYDPSKKYPLLVIIHGGPTGISIPEPTPSYVYPMVQWLNKGALILRPNYRGSAGYGEAFRSLNVENLGIGDAWDVLSGVQYLEDAGRIDPEKVAAMGWSQGGYISAFLTTNSTKFKAISVGAGISNWMTYYVNTDIHPFTRQYLKATPWSNPEIYEKTSPMTNINQATTPTLIQHGEFDKRVPVANAYELYQGLQDVGVETKLIIYKDFGHGINKPRERLAATWHNWQWFAKYIWGEEVEMPEK